MADSTRGTGLRICDMERLLKDIQMVIAISATLNWGRPMEKVCTHGQMERYMMVNGCKV